MASTQLSARANVAVSTSFQTKKSQSATTSASSSSSTRGRTFLVVEANKKVAKKTSVRLLLDSIEHVGEAGEMVSVSSGFFRNCLEPPRQGAKSNGSSSGLEKASGPGRGGGGGTRGGASHRHGVGHDW